MALDFLFFSELVLQSCCFLYRNPGNARYFAENGRRGLALKFRERAPVSSATIGGLLVRYLPLKRYIILKSYQITQLTGIRLVSVMEFQRDNS